MRCKFEGCKKKVSEFNDFSCSDCNKLYCGKHRLSFDHLCDTSKIKEKHVERIKKQNPVIMADKMEYKI
jgi:hypothetical protein